MLNASNLYSTGIPREEYINKMGSLVCVHVAAAAARAAVRCLHWAALSSYKASLLNNGQCDVCTGRRLQPKRMCLAAHSIWWPEIKVRGEKDKSS